MLIFYIFGCTQTTLPVSTSGPETVTDDTDDTDDTVEDTATTESLDSGLHDTADTATTIDTEDTGSEPSIAYDMAYFKSTHNSYSGEERGGIHTQLDAGFRGLEFDIHDNDFQTVQDYQLGHYLPGNEVDQEHGNPNGILLSDWLTHVKEWSIAHPEHAPITITLDLKDDLTDNASFLDGSMDRLNDILINTLGNNLFTPMYFENEWPSVDTLRNRYIIVLSGHEESRQLYKRDRGNNPSIAINEDGKVMEVHDSGSGTLWYWTGQMTTDGSVEWKRHGSYDTGQTPAIALNNDGWFVEVHQSYTMSTLWSRLGYIDDDYTPIFGDSEQYDSGVQPSIRFTNKSGFTLREIHQSQNTGANWDWEVTINPTNNSLAWGAHEQTADPLHDKNTDSSQDWIEVLTDVDKTAGSDTLLYQTQSGRQRIRYPQIAFVEYQHNNAAELIDSETWFAAVGSGSTSTLTSWNNAGLITRQWGFSETDSQNLMSPPNFPAVDSLSFDWYNDYDTQITFVE